MTLLLEPTAGVQVHASTLLVTASGHYVVAWFAGSHEGAADSTIHVLSSDDGAVRPIAPQDAVPHWNPVLAAGPDGATWLFYKRGHRIDEWTTWRCTSTDGGRTWSPPAELVSGDASGGRGPVRQAPVQVGELWVAPGSVEVWEPPRWDCFMDVSADAGRTWRQVRLPLDHDAVRGAGCIQPTLVALPDGTLVTLTRSSAGAVFRSVTRDPCSWPGLRPTTLPNNNSGIAAVGLADGRIVACHNDATDDWGARSRLVLSVSDDAGETWRQVRVVVDGAGGDASAPTGAPAGAAVTGVVTTGDGEYSYPAMQVVGDELWVSYSWQRRSIALERIRIAELSG
ncbi:exo-alpha-sialidase [Tessaracoccus terricola]